MVEGNGRHGRGAARPANLVVQPACDKRSVTNDDDCDDGAECEARDGAICRAMAVRKLASRTPFKKNKRSGSGGG